MQVGVVDVLGFAAGAAVFATYSMKTMIPLRLVGIVSNCLFIGYGWMAGAVPVLVLHAGLLPLNVWRLRQMVTLIAKVKAAAAGDLSMEWLKPFMGSRPCATGEVLFRAGDVADCMYCVVSGRYELVEAGIDVPAGSLVGEIGLVSPRNRRMLTFRCVEAGELLVMDYQRVRELYFQNPQFGFYLLRLVADRLIADMMANHEGAREAIRSSFGDLEPAAPEARQPAGTMA